MLTLLFKIKTAGGERVPLEARLLMQLRHPGIVRGMDTFTDNDKYVQLVMEKHGEMDLFEFIDRWRIFKHFHT